MDSQNYELEKAKINLEIAKIAASQAAPTADSILSTEQLNHAFNSHFTNISKKVWGES